MLVLVVVKGECYGGKKKKVVLRNACRNNLSHFGKARRIAEGFGIRVKNDSIKFDKKN